MDVLEANGERAVGQLLRVRRLGDLVDVLEPGKAARC
jgi:hypothetical protein